MLNLQLAEYIMKRRQNGDTDEAIKNDLISNQWKPEIVDEALGAPANQDEHIRIAVPNPSHLFSFNELFLEAFRMFKERFFSLLLLLIIPGVLAFLCLFMSGITVGLFAILAHLGSIATIVWVILIVIFSIGFVIFQTWCTVAVITSLCSAEKISFSEAFKRSWKNVFPFILINILLCAIILGGMTLLIIPAFIFSVWFNFSNFVLITDGDRGFNALMRSREIVKGHGWFVLGRYLLLGLLNLAVYLIIFVVFNIVLKMGSTSPIYSIISSLFSIVSSIFVLCYTFRLFSNLRDVKGKFDLEVSKKSKIVFSIIGIIGVLFIFVIPIVVLVAVNPFKQMQKAESITIDQDRSEISTAIMHYYSDNQTLPKTLIDLVPAYLPSIPTGTDKSYCFSANVIAATGAITVNYAKNDETLCNQVLAN